ncbi:MULTISPECIES: hypothetical protein [unclassified Capnocytophaga]|nr:MULTISPECIES: hypothetical protein [unclassified Capnocytophaga]MEB3004154.1 hypothetical protein [Capnocytophaga sp. G2]
MKNESLAGASHILACRYSAILACAYLISEKYSQRVPTAGYVDEK